MVDREGLASTTTVLTDVAVAVEDVAPGQGNLAVGHAHELAQADHRGEEQIGPDRVAGVMFQSLGLAFEKHHHGASPGGDVQGLIGRIENENVTHAGHPG